MPDPQTGEMYFGDEPPIEQGAPKPLPPPQTGAAQDTFWSSGPGGRILNAFAQGPKDLWGAAPTGLNPQTEAELKKAEANFMPGHDSFFKAVNEAVIRPAATAAESAWRTYQTPGAALATGFPQIGEEVSQAIAPGYQPEGNVPKTPQQALVALGGAATEVGGAVARGEALIPELGIFAWGGLDHAVLADQAARARSIGAIGEGEAGYYGAEPVSPENIQARTDAAHEAGIEPTPPAPPVPDVHALARRIDPETFEQYDALALEREQHRETIAALGEQRANSPEALEAQGQIDTILGKVNNVPSRLTNAATERLNAAQERLDTILHTDSPEMTAARNGLMNADFAMRDLAPEVSEAYRQAADMMPAKPVEAVAAEPRKAAEAEGDHPATVSRETPAETATQAQAVPQRTPAEEAGVRAATAAGATPEGLAEVAPANVLGEQKLGEGKPTRGMGAMKAVEGTGETATRGLAEHVEERAIEEGLTTGFGDLPAYERLSMKDQAAKVAEFMDRDYEMAKEVAMGRRAAPEGILPESVFVGVEKRAVAEGDVETIQQLATRSRLTTAATTMGQRIRTLGERDPSSPVGLIQEVQKARETEMAKTRDIAAAKAETIVEARTEMRQAASKIDAWGAFIKSVECT